MGRIIPYILENKQCLKPPTSGMTYTCQFEEDKKVSHSHIHSGTNRPDNGRFHTGWHMGRLFVGHYTRMAKLEGSIRVAKRWFRFRLYGQVAANTYHAELFHCPFPRAIHQQQRYGKCNLHPYKGSYKPCIPKWCFLIGFSRVFTISGGSFCRVKPSLSSAPTCPNLAGDLSGCQPWSPVVHIKIAGMYGRSSP